MTINVALVGLGYWGPNLARSIATASGARLHTLCDTRPARLDHLRDQYPHARMTSEFDSVLADPEVDGIVIATPVPTHFSLARASIEAGKSVLVEKPLAQSSDECRQLIDLARSRSVVLMAGHVFIYNAAVEKVKSYIDSGELGDVRYVYSQRLNLGQVRHDVNALWNFAPHDLSILDYWLGAGPRSVVARGYAYVQPDIEDVVFMTLDYPNGVAANVHISWLDPLKVRQMTVVGTEKMVVYDDVSAEARIRLYDKAATRGRRPGAPRDDMQSPEAFETFGEWQVLLRAGDVLIPKIDFTEPLKVECQHFVDCISTGSEPRTGGESALRVVRGLEAAERSMKSGGAPQLIEDPVPA